MPSLICPELPQDIKKHLNIEASYSALSVNHCPPVSLVNPQREHISADFLLGSRTTSSRAELPWGTRAARLCVSLYISLHALWNISMCQIWSLKATEEVCKVKGLCLIHTNTHTQTHRKKQQNTDHILPGVMSSWWFTCIYLFSRKGSSIFTIQ